MANMIVSGAGESLANGIYIETGTVNGRPQYVLTRSQFSHFNIVWNTIRWTISQQEDTTYYYGDYDVSTPDLVTEWTVRPMYGTPPAPTVTLEQSGTTHEGEATLSSLSYLRTKKS